MPRGHRQKRLFINVGGTLRNLFGVASDADRIRDEHKLEDKIREIYKVRDVDKRLMAKIMKKEDRMILSNTEHLTAVDNSITKMPKMLLQTGTEMQLILEMNKLDAKVESLYWNKGNTSKHLAPGGQDHGGKDLD